jgi:hypothetical protein
MQNSIICNRPQTITISVLVRLIRPPQGQAETRRVIRSAPPILPLVRRNDRRVLPCANTRLARCGRVLGAAQPDLTTAPPG